MTSQDARLPAEEGVDAESYGSIPLPEPKLQGGGPLTSPLMQRHVCELVGTFVLAFTFGCIESHGTALYNPLAMACVLTVLIYSMGPISGGFFNPAVSLAFGMCGKLPMMDVVSYSVAQLIGAYLGCLAVMEVFPTQQSPLVSTSHLEVGLVEAAFTSMLSFVALNVLASIRNNPSQDQNQFFALAIGFVFVAAGYAIGPISGCILNPALALALDATHGGVAALHASLFYAACELGGGALASTVFIACRPEELQADEQQVRATYVPAARTQMMAEMVGTFAIVFTAGLNSLVRSESAVWSTAAALMCMVYSLWDVSGAHFNPAVSLAVALSGREAMGEHRWKLVGAYWSAQLSAAVLAALAIAHFHLQNDRTLYRIASATDMAPTPVGTSAATFSTIQPLGVHGWAMVFVGEMVFTALLGFTVLTALTVTNVSPSLSSQNFFFALAIAASLMAGGVAIGSVSGAKLSPAMVVAAWAEGTVLAGRDWNGPRLGHAAVYVSAQLLGGVVAALLFFIMRPDEYRDKANRSGRNTAALNRSLTQSVGQQLVHAANREQRSSVRHHDHGPIEHAPHMAPTWTPSGASSDGNTTPLSGSSLPEAIEDLEGVVGDIMKACSPGFDEDEPVADDAP